MEDTDTDRPKRPSRTQSAVIIDEEPDGRDTNLSKESWLFVILILLWEILMIIIYAIWIRPETDAVTADEEVVLYYDYFRFGGERRREGFLLFVWFVWFV